MQCPAAKNAAIFDRRVSKRGGSSWIMTTAEAPPCLKPLTAESSVKMVRSEFHRAMAASAPDLMVSGSSDLFETPSRLEKMVTVPWCTHGGFLVRLISCLSSASVGMYSVISCFPYLAQLLCWVLGLMCSARARLHGWWGERSFALSMDFRVLR